MKKHSINIVLSVIEKNRKEHDPIWIESCWPENIINLNAFLSHHWEVLTFSTTYVIWVFYCEKLPPWLLRSYVSGLVWAYNVLPIWSHFGLRSIDLWLSIKCKCGHLYFAATISSRRVILHLWKDKCTLSFNDIQIHKHGTVGPVSFILEVEIISNFAETFRSLNNKSKTSDCNLERPQAVFF